MLGSVIDVPGEGLLELQQTMLSIVWRKRWCLARNGELKIYTSLTKPARDSVPTQVLPLLKGATSVCSMAPCGKGSKHRVWGFNLVVESAIGKKSSYTFACEDDEHSRTWVQAVKDSLRLREVSLIARFSLFKAAQLGDTDTMWHLLHGKLLPPGSVEPGKEEQDDDDEHGEGSAARGGGTPLTARSGHEDGHHGGFTHGGGGGGPQLQVERPFLYLDHQGLAHWAAQDINTLNSHSLTPLHYSAKAAMNAEAAGETRRFSRWLEVESRELLKMNANPDHRAAGGGLSALQVAQDWCFDCKAYNKYCKACCAKHRLGSRAVWDRLWYMKETLVKWKGAKAELERLEKLREDQDGYMSGEQSSSSDEDEAVVAKGAAAAGAAAKARAAMTGTVTGADGALHGLLDPVPEQLGADGVPVPVRLKGGNAVLGRRVQRGEDWSEHYGDQDGGEGNYGTLVAFKRGDGQLVANAAALRQHLDSDSTAKQRRGDVDMAKALKYYPYPMSVVRWDTTGIIAAYPMGHKGRFAITLKQDEPLSPRARARLARMAAPVAGVKE
jgi:hypothetical protein